MTLPISIAAKLRLPVVCAPLFIISNPALVIAQCKAGVVGSFPSLNARPASLVDEWLHQITEELAAWDRDHPETPAAPFAVNQIVHRTNDRLDHDMELCAKYKVPLIITSLGAREDINHAAHAWGGLVLHDIIDDRYGRKAIEKGADGLIAVGSGAGGHAGRLSPFALIQELRQWFDGPIALSGAIATGRAILAAQAMGADLAYIGSMFIASSEANADEAYKQMIVDSRSADIVYTNLFTGVHGNYLRPSIVRAGLDPDNLPQSDPSAMSFGSGGGAKAWRDIWGCGQGIGAIDDILPAGERVERLARDYKAARRELAGKVARYASPPDSKTISGFRVRTQAEIRAKALRVAQGFRQLGVGEGDTVALFLRNDFAFFEASLGASLAGAYVVPLNWHSTIDEAAYILRDCGAKVFVVHRDLFPAIAGAVPAGVPVLVVDTPDEIAAVYRRATVAEPATGCENWEAWIGRHGPLSDPASASRAAVIYTSGTTGKPKGVQRAPDRNGQMLRTAAIGYGLDDDGPKTVLINGPMYHTAPNSYARLAFERGADLVLQARFDAEEMLALIERHQITHMHIVPTMFVRLLRLPAEIKAKYDLSSLRSVVHGAAPCPPNVKQAMIKWWGPVIREYYGSSETGLITGHDSREALAKPGTVGRPLPGTIVRILSEDGRDLPPGEQGDIYVHSKGNPDFTYIGLDEQRAEIAQGEFVTVGDVGYIDEDGYLFLCDRRRDVIISGGVNIYSAEIEDALHSLEEIGDCAVFGVPDEEFGEAVCAYLQPHRFGGAIDIAAVREQLGQKLSRFKIPKHIKIVDELPREDSGKIFKRKLREPYWRDLARA